MIGRVRALWRGTAVRERRLLVVLAFVALCAATLSAMDWSGDMRDAHVLASADASQARIGRGGGDDLDLRARRELTTLTQGAVQATDVWMARIVVEQRLSSAATQAGVAEARIIVDAQDGQPSASVVTAELTGVYDGGAVIAVLETLESQGLRAFVDALEADRGEGGRFRLLLSFPVTLDQGAAA